MSRIGQVYNCSYNSVSKPIPKMKNQSFNDIISLKKLEEKKEMKGSGLLEQIATLKGESQEKINQNSNNISGSGFRPKYYDDIKTKYIACEVNTGNSPIISKMPSVVKTPQQQKIGLVEHKSDESKNLLPGDKLRLKLLKKMLKQKKSSFTSPSGKTRGGGVGRRENNEPMTGNGIVVAGGGINPAGGGIGYGLRLAGQGNDMIKKTSAMLVPKIIEEIEPKMKMKYNAKMRDMMIKLLDHKMNKSKSKNYLKSLSQITSHILIPILLKLTKSPVSKKNQKLLEIILAKELFDSYKYIYKYSGSGLFGKSSKWWKNFGKKFAKGFRKVAKPGSKILGATATALGHPEIGAVLGAVGEVL